MYNGVHVGSNMSKKSASVSSGVPDTEKQMKARCHTSQTSVRI